MKNDASSNRKRRWKELHDKERANISGTALKASRRGVYALSLNLGPARIDKGRNASRGLVDHVFRTMSYHLERELGRIPSFWIVVEDIHRDGRERRRPHVHGVISIEPDEKSAMKCALLKVAGDTDPARAIRLVTSWRIEGWVNYCFKNLGKGDPDCTGFKMASPLRKTATRIYDRGRWTEIRDKVQEAEIAALASDGDASVSYGLGATCNTSPEPLRGRAVAGSASDDYTPSPRFEEQIRRANASLAARMFGSHESSLRRRADEIASQIESLGGDDDPSIMAMQRKLERDRREVLARADHLLAERIAILSKQRSPEHADFASLYASA